MQRREFMRLAGWSVAAFPMPAWAQPRRAPGKIGVVNMRPATITVAIMRPVLQRLGYVEGESLLLRNAEGDLRRLPDIIDELIDQRVGVLIVVGPEALQAAHRATRTLPIVAIDLETDPVRSGLATSIGRPGGNITGLFLDQPTLAAKWVELLLELAPQVNRVILHWDRTTGTDQLEVSKAAAALKGIEAVVLEMGTYVSFDQAFAQFVGIKSTGIIQLGSPGFSALAESFAAAALKHRLPTMTFLKVYAQAGGLMSYGPNQEDYFPRAVAVADNILRGEKASEMPIEHPTRLELVINGRTAKALGLIIPPTLRTRADEVIE